MPHLGIHTFKTTELWADAKQLALKAQITSEELSAKNILGKGKSLLSPTLKYSYFPKINSKLEARVF